jgi:hypothetical protein
MVMIVKSKEWSKAYDEMKRRLYCEIWQYMEELGISHGFFLDSKTIQDAMETIANRVANLSERVIISEDLIRMHKESKKFKRQAG